MSDNRRLQKKKEREKRIRSDRARQSRMNDAQWNMDLAFYAYNEGDLQKAGLYLQKALHLKPDWNYALNLKAGIALRLPKPDLPTACICLEKILKKDPEDLKSIFTLAHSYFMSGRFADEIALLEDFLDRYKQNGNKKIDLDKRRARAWLKEARENEAMAKRQASIASSLDVSERAAMRAGREQSRRSDPDVPISPAEPVRPQSPVLDLSLFEDYKPLRIVTSVRVPAGEPDFGARISSSAPGPLIDYNLRLQYQRLRLLKDFEELLCLEHLNGVAHYWYQVETAISVLKRFRGRVLLADEVGLGKTIEAGMIIKEYILRGLAGKVLILTPPSLVLQWQEEMAGKFGLAFVTPEHDSFREDAEAFWRNQDLVIASINTAKSSRHFDTIASIDYDLVVVDEAHYLRNKKTLNHQLVSAIRKRFLLLLSATPVQNNLLELYNLITLLQPGLLSTEAAFKRDYIKKGNLRQPNNPEQLRRLLKEVMIRNTRSMVDVRLPKRLATTLYIPPENGERETYELLSACTRLLHKSDGAKELFTIRNLQMAAGSSPFALRDASVRLEARLADDGHPAAALLKDLNARLAGAYGSSKGVQVLELVEKNDDKKLIFVRYQKTLEYLADLFQRRRLPFVVFSGTMSAAEKDAAIDSFRREAPILISTEAGGEGRNIQFCNTLINYDLPWNPMRLEQRIGRIHRIGQQRDVFIFNLCLAGSIEDYMMRILDDKINMFELVIGEIDTILGNLDADRDFGNLILDAWLNSGGDSERRENFDRLGEDIIEAKKVYERTKALDEMIFGDDYEV